MKENERNQNTWAAVGKIAAVFLTIFSLIKGTIETRKYYKEPTLDCSFKRMESCPDPEVRSLLLKGVDKGKVLEFIASNLNATNAVEVLSRLHDELISTNEYASLDLNRFRFLTTFWFFEFNVNNSGDETARSVRILLPGSGKVDIFDSGIFEPKHAATNWSGNIPLGDIRPGGIVRCRVWYDSIAPPMIYGLNPSVHYENGTVAVREAQEFWGWDAEIVMSFLQFPFWKRASIIAAFVFVIASAIFLAVRKGYIVLKPKLKQITTSGVYE